MTIDIDPQKKHPSKLAKILDVLKPVREKGKYYSLQDILDTPSAYKVIIGERSNGKTYGTLEYCLKEYIDSVSEGAITPPRQFIYLRRWKEDITPRRVETIFNPFKSKIKKWTNGKWSTVRCVSGKFYLANYDADAKRKWELAEEPFAYAMALSEMEHDKSTAYPWVHNIIFDEFISRQYYLVDEFVLFMNVLSTVIRDRTIGNIFMLGNTVNQYNPYFVEMGIDGTKLQQGTISIFQFGADTNSMKVAVEYCAESGVKEKTSSKYFAFNNPKLNMIKGGSWEMDIYPHLQHRQTIRPESVVFEFFIFFNDSCVQGEVVEQDNDVFLFFHKRTRPLTPQQEREKLIYRLEPSTMPNVRRNILSPALKIEDKIIELFRRDKVFYDTNATGEVVINYMKNSGNIMNGMLSHSRV